MDDMEFKLDLNRGIPRNASMVDVSDGKSVPFEFFYMAVEIAFKSAELGRPFFEQREFIRFYVPGGKNIVEREVREEDKRMFRRQYEAFKSSLEQPVNGVPLQEMPGITVAEIANLRTLHVLSVEQLAEANDLVLQDFGHGARALQKRARDWLEATQGVTSIKAKNQELEEKNTALAADLAQIKEQLAMLMAQGALSTQPPVLEKPVEPVARVEAKQTQATKPVKGK